MEGELRTRDQALTEETWAIEDLYSNDDLWQKDYEALKEDIGHVAVFEGRLSQGPQQVYDFLRLEDQLNTRLERIYVYASQKLHEDTANGHYQNLSAKAGQLMVDLGAAFSFGEPEMLNIPEADWTRWYLKLPELLHYKTYIDRILEERTHILNPEVESVLTQAGEIGQGPSQIFAMFNNADIKFGTITDSDGKDIEVTHGRYTGLLKSRDRQVRRQAFKAMYQAYEAYSNTLAALYQANVKKNCFFARVRNYDSAMAMSLGNNRIPVTVYEKLLEAVHDRLPLMYQYMDIRKKCLGADDLHMYDLYVPMLQETNSQTYDFEKAKALVKEGLAPLGKDYLNHLEEGFANRWIDIYENRGKRSGAYSWGAYGVHPYVLLNFQGQLSDVFTLAHEMGHALHSYFSDEGQDYRYASYSIFVAEVASTVNETLLIRYLIETTENKQQKLQLINYLLEQFRTTLYRQTMFAEFEKMAHELVWTGETLTPQVLCDIYKKLNETYFGPEVVIDSEIAMEWARIPHFYTAFYVYQYATGFSAAMAISGKIIKGDEAALKGYFQFLHGGCSKDPLELLKLCGVDMSQTTVIHEALDVFETYLQEFERMTKDEL